MAFLHILPATQPRTLLSPFCALPPISSRSPGSSKSRAPAAHPPAPSPHTSTGVPRTTQLAQLFPPYRAPAIGSLQPGAPGPKPTAYKLMLFTFWTQSRFKISLPVVSLTAGFSLAQEFSSVSNHTTYLPWSFVKTADFWVLPKIH